MNTAGFGVNYINNIYAGNHSYEVATDPVKANKSYIRISQEDSYVLAVWYPDASNFNTLKKFKTFFSTDEPEATNLVLVDGISCFGR